MIKKKINAILRFFKNSITYLESDNIPIGYAVISLFFAATLRNFVETYSDHMGIEAEYFTHYDLSYLFLASAIVALFHVFTKTPVIKIIKVVFPCFLVLLVAPISDLIISKGQGIDIMYMLPGKHENLLLRYFTFFGDFYKGGISPGMRIEIGLVIISSFIYFFIKTKKILLSILAAVSLYTLIFLYCMFPVIIKFIIELTGHKYYYSPDLMSKAFLFFFFIVGIIVAWQYNKEYVKIILKDIRPYRLLHFIFMFYAGALLSGYTIVSQFTLKIYMGLVLTPISITFAWLFSVITNNLADINIDKISNKERPHVKSNVDIKTYKTTAWIFFVLSLVYALIDSYRTFFFILMFIGNYFMYSMPPLRLKRFLIPSKMLIAINSLILLLAGYMLYSWGNLGKFPLIIYPVFLIGFTLVISFIDLKDHEGDKKEGIKTLPVLIGLKKAKLFIGVIFIIDYCACWLIFKEWYILAVAGVFGIVQFILVNRKNYNEKPIFIVYLVSMLLILVYIYFNRM